MPEALTQAAKSAEQLAHVPVDQLVDAVTQVEKRTWFDDNPEFWPIHAARFLLSSAAWEPYGAAAYDLYGHASPPLSMTGIAQGPLDRTVADRFMKLIEQSPPTLIRYDDFTPGFMADTKRFSAESQNENNIYYEVTPEMLAAQ